MIDKKFKIANKIFKSRLIVGTGKYKSFSECAKAIKTSGADIVTVAVRRVNISSASLIATDVWLYPPALIIIPSNSFLAL